MDELAVSQLEKIIQEADRAYYTTGTSGYTDAEYDSLKRKLAELDPENKLLQSLGEDHVAGSMKRSHTMPMLSLAKLQATKDNDASEEVRRWATEHIASGVTVEAKIDGMSAEVVYVFGKLSHVSTRGNGITGDDITNNTKQCFPSTIPEWGGYAEMAVRGELYISKNEFARINKEQEAAGLDLFANARNLCAGTVKSKEFIPGRKICFAAHGFGLIYASNDNPRKSFINWYRELERLGFATVQHTFVRTDVDNVMREVEKIKDMDLDYYIDGAVIKLNNIDKYLELGNTAHHPRGAIAYKFLPEAKETEVINIEWQIGGKTGKATPVAIISPVDLSGSVVSRVSLANAGLMAHRGIQVGAKVKVEKANEIIPHIVEVLTPTTVELPDTMPCPCCGTTMTLIQGKTAPTADYICPNEACTAKLAARLQQALGASGLNILGIGPETCYDFITDNPGLNAATFIQLTKDEYPDSLSELQKDNLYKAARAARQAPLWRWLSAMMIPGIGPGSAKALSQKFKNMRELAIAVASDIPLCVISEARETALRDYIASEGNIMTELVEMSINPESDNYVETVSEAAPLSGLSFVVTGTFVAGRGNIEKLIPTLGGALKVSVSKKTSYVVCGADPGATKISKAKSLNIPIITEEEFVNLIKNANQKNRAEELGTSQIPES